MTRRSFIQGPPGSGKTYTGARLIVRLLARQGCGSASPRPRTRPSATCSARSRRAPPSGPSVPRAEEGTQDNPESTVRRATTSQHDDNERLAAGDAEVRLLAGTHVAVGARGHARGGRRAVRRRGRPGLARRRRSRCRERRRAARPARRPAAAGAREPGHAPARLRGVGARAPARRADTVPRDRGVFLDRTWRMHPDVCAFVSRRDVRRPAARDGRLRAPARRRRRPAGAACCEVEHDEQPHERRPKRRERIARRSNACSGGRSPTRTGETRALTLDDILVVAPYNAQVALPARSALPDGARVGTVDKFQGQEAPVVFFSMTSSSGEDVAARHGLPVQPQPPQRRGLARAGARVVVCSPRLLWAPCNTVEQMRSSTRCARSRRRRGPDARAAGATRACIPVYFVRSRVESP